MTHLIDHYLLFRLRVKRDPEAFGQLYDRYVASIYRFVYLKLPSKETAEDVTSETFLRCWQFLQGSHQEITNIRAFLYQIARNLVIDQYRKQGSRPEQALSTVTSDHDDTSSDKEQFISDASRGKDLIEARADLSLVLERMRKLKTDYQDVLTLRLIDGLAFGDIAQILNKSTGAVRVIFHRAIKALDSLDKKASS